MNYAVPPLYLVRSKKRDQTTVVYVKKRKKKTSPTSADAEGFLARLADVVRSVLGKKKIQEGLEEKATHRAHSAESCACNNNKKKKKKKLFFFIFSSQSR